MILYYYNPWKTGGLTQWEHCEISDNASNGQIPSFHTHFHRQNCWSECQAWGLDGADTAKGAVQVCSRTRDRTLTKGWNHKRCGYSTQPVMSEVTQLRQTIELINPCSTLTSTFFWRTSVYSLAIVHGYVTVQRIFISSKNKMYRQLLAVFLVSPEGSGDCKPDFTYYKIQ